MIQLPKCPHCGKLATPYLQKTSTVEMGIETSFTHAVVYVCEFNKDNIQVVTPTWVNVIEAEEMP